MVDIHQAALECLLLSDPAQKRTCIDQYWHELVSCDQFSMNFGRVDRVRLPGRPVKPELVPAKEVPRRGLGSDEGRAALYHSLAHIEFNAINLSLDAVYRFRGLPPSFYRDWWSVAFEEAKHFGLLNERMRQMGYEYGSFPAHNHLWQVTYDTDFDVMVRMALVPRVLEARGLDMAPLILKKLQSVGDQSGVEILKVILAEEVGHVEIGNRWYLHYCELRGLDPLTTFSDLLRRLGSGAISGPFNTEARLEAGFTEADMLLLKEIEAEFKSEIRA
ncbi:MAG: ferritin-like domain-containing protein [Gammaproteobacteria bacterium]|nr:ferritin-like domain-containing protein [Gammaproteobacteria bacterium]